jgi:hypothetical protein
LKLNGRYETLSEVKRLQIYNGYMQRPFPNGHKCPFGRNGYVTAVAAGQSQRFYSGVGIFNWYYLSSPPQILRGSRFDLELRGLMWHVAVLLLLSLPYLTSTIGICVLHAPHRARTTATARELKLKPQTASIIPRGISE